MKYIYAKLALIILLLCNITLLQSQLQNNAKILVSDSADQFISGFSETSKQESGNTIKISANETLTLDFNIRKEEGKLLTLLGSVNQTKYSYYWITYLNGEIKGHIIQRDKMTAYKIFTSTDSKVYLEETDINSLVCIGLPKIELPASQKLARRSDCIPPTPVYQLESKPGSPNVIYLDFDGETFEGGTNTNVYLDEDPFVAPPLSYSECQFIEIWEVVAEDFSPFDVNVTTNREVFESVPWGQKQMVVYTSDSRPSDGSPGTGPDGSFYSAEFNEPAWVHVNYPEYAGGPKIAGDTGSHEVGHTLLLNHHGKINQTMVDDNGDTVPAGDDYYLGHGNWNAIMGQGVQNSVVQWSKGEYAGATNAQQDDISIIEGHLGFSEDLHGNTTTAATMLNADLAEGRYVALDVENSGIIQQSTDIDMFKFTAGEGEANFMAIPYQSITNPGSESPNLNIQMRLLDSEGEELASDDREDSLSATITYGLLTAGTYYLEISGQKEGTVDDGYSKYGSLGQFSISGTYPTETNEPLLPVPTGLEVTASTPYTVDLTWDELDPPVLVVVGYNIHESGAQVGQTTGMSSVTVTGLQPGATYSFTVASRDADGNESEKSNALIFTAPGLAKPTNLVASDITETTLSLNWAQPDPSDFITGYRVYKNGDILATVAESNFPVVGLTAGEPYTFYVKAIYASDNESDASNEVSVTTLGGQDGVAPDEVTGLIVSNRTSTSFVLSWAAPDHNIGIASYAVFIDGNPEPLGTTNGDTLTFPVTGLTPSTTYNIRVRATDDAGNVSPEGLGTDITTLPQGPSKPILSVSDITLTSFVLSWEPSTSDVGVVRYEVLTFGPSPLPDPPATISYPITDRIPGTTYTIGVVAFDADGHRSEPGEIEVTTLPDTEDPSVVTGLVASNITSSSFVLSWTASTDNYLVDEYRITGSGDAEPLIFSRTTTSTSYTQVGLSPGTTYTISAIAIDAFGNESEPSSPPIEVTTLAVPDTDPPDDVTGLEAFGINVTHFVLNWNIPDDNVGVTEYEVFVDNVLKKTTTTSLTDVTGLMPGNTYVISVVALDAAGNKSEPATIEVTTLSDTTPPAEVTDLVFSNVTSNSVDLSWNEPLDDVGVKGYQIYVNGNPQPVISARSGKEKGLMSKTTDTDGTPQPMMKTVSSTVTGLMPETSYTIFVIAVDAAGNRSVEDPLNEITIVTLAAPPLDTDPPTSVTGLVLSNITETSIDLMWSPSNVNEGVVEYRVYVNGMQDGSTGDTSYTLTSLLPGVPNFVAIVAVDAAGNESTCDYCH